MNKLNLGIVIVTVLILTSLAFSCNTKLPTTLSATTSNSSTLITPSPNNSAPSPPMSVEASFPGGAPALNQTAELIVMIKTPSININNIDLKVGLPDGFELVRGGLSWQGDVPIHSELTVMSAMVKAVKAGSWTIKVTSYLDQSKNGGFGGTINNPVYVLISENSAEWRTVAAYPTPGVPTISPGQVVRVDKWGAIQTGITISQAPRLNETARLYITTVSTIDFPGLSIGILIYPKSAVISEDGTSLTPIQLVPGADQLAVEVTGVDLRANVPYQFSTQVVFKDTGYYTIAADARQIVDNVSHHGQQDQIYLKIGVNQSTIEKQPPPATPSGINPPPPPAAPPTQT